MTVLNNLRVALQRCEGSPEGGVPQIRTMSCPRRPTLVASAMSSRREEIALKQRSPSGVSTISAGRRSITEGFFENAYLPTHRARCYKKLLRCMTNTRVTPSRCKSAQRVQWRNSVDVCRILITSVPAGWGTKTIVVVDMGEELPWPLYPLGSHALDANDPCFTDFARSLPLCGRPPVER